MPPFCIHFQKKDLSVLLKVTRFIRISLCFYLTSLRLKRITKISFAQREIYKIY